MWHHVTPCDIIWHHVTSSDTTWHHPTLRDIIRHYVTYHLTPFDIIQHYVTSSDTMWHLCHHVTPCDVALQLHHVALWQYMMPSEMESMTSHDITWHITSYYILLCISVISSHVVLQPSCWRISPSSTVRETPDWIMPWLRTFSKAGTFLMRKQKWVGGSLRDHTWVSCRREGGGLGPLGPS